MINDFSSIPLKISYDSGIDDVLWHFYIPVLSLANSYDRIAGFFSSSSLALCARGMESFILRGGKMRLVTCPQLSKADVDMLNKTVNSLDDILVNNFIDDYNKIETQFQKDHVQALGWMLANRKLEIKIAVLTKNGKFCNEDEINESGIMHQKVGIFYDQAGNIISFSGSNNESASGWMENTEEFKVFSSWTGAMPYIKEDINKFNSFWNGTRLDVKMLDIPEALKKEIIKISSNFEPSMISIKKYYDKKILNKKKELKPFYYQQNAIDMWNDNGRNMLLQMATGCGKTRTAIGCMKLALMDTNKLLIVVSCPQATLSAQWKKDIDGLDIPIEHSLEINGTVTGWTSIFNMELLKLSTGLYNNLIIYTTHQICSSEKYLTIIKKISSKINIFFVGDEVHGMGADKTRRGLIEEYNYRIGLSATPQRWFDDDGSKLIEDYFGNRSFEFSLADALSNHNPYTGKPFLVNYSYEPRFISLTEDEIEEYKKITDKIVKMARYTDSDSSDILQMLKFKRADIEKNAENKYVELEKILDEIGDSIQDTIIFVSAEQIDKVMRILGRRNISASRFTQAQSTAKSELYGGISEREYIINLFKAKKYQVLVAIKCLDEGIDIPSADTAIVMASSTNPREYVQRIGRIIRQDTGKYKATIYDLILRPSLNLFYDDKLIEMETKIFRKEMDRVVELSENAINNVSVLNTVYNILWEVTG